MTKESPKLSWSIRSVVVRAIVMLAFAVAFGVVYKYFGDALTLKGLAGYEQSLRTYEASHYWTVLFGALILYIVVSGLSIPGGAVALTLVYGSYFGILRALVIVSFGSTAGATLAFLMSRYLFRELIQQRFGDRLATINARLAEEGALYLFTLRLIPAVPYFMLNLVMGLTRMKTWTYWWVSQVGMLAGTLAYVYAGSTLKLSVLARDGFQGLGIEFWIAFAILGLLPIIVKRAVVWLRPRSVDSVVSP